MDTQGLKRLPDGCECRLDFYLTSDSTGLEVKLGLGGMTSIPDTIEPAPAMKLVQSLGVAVAPLEEMADDWRFMSRAEIAEYKQQEQEDED
jgi:hypothetical protein